MNGSYVPVMLEDDEPVLALAGQGDRSAQLRMVDHVLACGDAGTIPVGVALGAAEVFARMAAADAGLVARRKLGGVLLLQSQNLWVGGFTDRARIYQIEAMALMSALADDGDEHSAALLIQFGEAFSPAILRLAADLARATDGGMGDAQPSHDTIS